MLFSYLQIRKMLHKLSTYIVSMVMVLLSCHPNLYIYYCPVIPTVVSGVLLSILVPVWFTCPLDDQMGSQVTVGLSVLTIYKLFIFYPHKTIYK